MRFIRKLIYGRSLRQLILPTGVLFLAVYLLLFSTTYGKSASNNISRRLKLFLTSSNSAEYTSKEFCNPTSIERRVTDGSDTEQNEKITCKQHVASKEACKLAKELYYTNPSLKTCGYSRPVDICRYNLMDDTKQGSSSSLKISCSIKDCKKYKRPNVLVWLPSTKTGTLSKKDYFTNEKDLQKHIDGVISKARTEEGASFLLLECVDSMDVQREAYDFVGQMFLIPPVPEKQYNQQAPKANININLVMIDSVARSHFYRSLPHTISTFSKINKYRHVKAEVLDFELFQSLEGHTAENIHGLFTGKLFPKTFTGQERERSAVGVGDFLKIWKNNGYKTIYQDDLCFDDYWGMRLDLGTPNNWDEFVKAKSDNHIDSIGRLLLQFAVWFSLFPPECSTKGFLFLIYTFP